MKRAVFSLVALLAFAAPVRAQVPSNANSAPSGSVNFGRAAQPAGPGAHGFTVMANMGVGFEHDFFYGGAAGLAGPNFGIGRFITPRIAILGRFSGTAVEFDEAGFSQTSWVVGGTVQYWLTSRCAVEAGGGLGSWADEFGGSDAGGGLMFGVSYVVWEKGAHHIVAGAEYAPVLTDGKVHNVGITVGYQFFKRR